MKFVPHFALLALLAANSALPCPPTQYACIDRCIPQFAQCKQAFSPWDRCGPTGTPAEFCGFAWANQYDCFRRPSASPAPPPGSLVTEGLASPAEFSPGPTLTAEALQAQPKTPPASSRKVPAVPAVPTAPSAPSPALRCEARGIAPGPGSEYVGRCFLSNIDLTLNDPPNGFRFEESFTRKKCGGWLPYSPEESGSFVAGTNGVYELRGENFAGLLSVEQDSATLVIRGQPASPSDGPLPLPDRAIPLHCSPLR